MAKKNKNKDKEAAEFATAAAEGPASVGTATAVATAPPPASAGGPGAAVSPAAAVKSLKDISDMDGAQKAAAVVVALGVDKAALIYEYMDAEELEQLTLEVARMGFLDADTSEAVLTEYYQMCMTNKAVTEGGEEVLFAGLVKESELPVLQGLGHLVKQLTGGGGTEGLFQNGLRVLQPALGDRLVGHAHLIILGEHGLAGVRVQEAHPGNLQGELFQLLRVHVLVDERGLVHAQGHHNGGGFLGAVHVGNVLEALHRGGGGHGSGRPPGRGGGLRCGNRGSGPHSGLTLGGGSRCEFSRLLVLVLHLFSHFPPLLSART